MLGRKSGQMGFGDLEAMGRLPEGHFLKKIDSQINWRPFEKLLEPLYHPSLGRPSHPPLVMFKALLLQQWYGLSDPGLEEAICDRLSFQRFLGLSLQDPVPDETRIGRFRNMLAQADLGEHLFGLLAEQLDARGLIVRRGSLIDATLVKSQAHPPRKGEVSPDPEADWTRRGKDGHFGYKVHLSVDQGSGLLRRLALTAASVSESHLFEEMVIGDEAAVFADGAYAKDARKMALRSRGGVLRHHQPGLALSGRDLQTEAPESVLLPGARGSGEGHRHSEAPLWDGAMSLSRSGAEPRSFLAGGDLL